MAESGTRNRVFVRLRRNPAEQLFAAAFFDNGNLIVVASQIIMRALCNHAVQYRAGNHAVVRANQFAGGNLRHLRTQNGTQEARFVDLRAAQGNHALGIQTTCYE
ncbi:Uncharacterised protein [Mycobacteroides abscessus subsp. massiliense]|nr:Uncharacterised protein [Mycobacteroides abscessus subsp. massiliense]